MKTAFANKSTVDEIRRRFDGDVERFSRLESGQQATIDAPLVLDLVSAAARTHVPAGGTMLDLGYGAGNFTLRVMQAIGPLECHLVDLSRPMLDRAAQRVSEAGARSVRVYQGDLRQLSLPEEEFDLVVAGAVLHHLRSESEWDEVFGKVWKWLKPGGRFYVADLVTFADPEVDGLMWKRYGDYLEGLGGPGYRETVFRYIDREDTPRSLPFQIAGLQKAGFQAYDILHRNSVFACYFARK
ncbi:MAG: class I SAM-dependent methyltransferase [Verrucomicrobia bacterium]|nr:class I SAM-dependent methyltransferase [Verrucomicrobiota bacterium]